MTKAQIHDIIDTFIAQNRRLPKPKELSTKTDGAIDTKQATGFLLAYKKKIVQLFVMPDGRVYDKDGVTVWHQNTAGSMMPASFYPDKGVGQYISH